MRVLASTLRSNSIDPSEITVADRVALALGLGGRCAQDLVVTFHISRSEAKRLLKVREQLGRPWSPCSLAILNALSG